MFDWLNETNKIDNFSFFCYIFDVMVDNYAPIHKAGRNDDKDIKLDIDMDSHISKVSMLPQNLATVSDLGWLRLSSILSIHSKSDRFSAFEANSPPFSLFTITSANRREMGSVNFCA